MSSDDQSRLKGKKRVSSQTAGSPDVKKSKPSREGDRFCWICHREPSTLWCDTCPRSYHASCVNLKVRSLSEWVCPECVRVMAAENVDTRSPALALFSADEFCSLLQFALQRLKQHTHEAFLKPVCTKTYPKYTDYVSHPFDLSILEKNVRWKHYGCTESFLSDARWIYHNCIVFNGYNHKLTMSAKVLMKVCKQEMEDIEVCPDCYKNANTQESWFTEPCRRPHLLVWAKLKGFPYWPAKVMRLQDGNVDCRFFGAHDRAWVPMNQCFLLSKESPTDTKNRKKGLQNAIEELEIYVRKYREKFGEYRYSALRTTLTAEDFHCSKADPVPTSQPLPPQPQQQEEEKEKDSETFGRSPRSELSSDSPRKELWSGTPGSSREKSLASSAGSTPTRAEPRKENNQRMSSLTPKREPVSTKEERGFLPPLPDGAPQGIFEVSSELPGELQMKVSKEDMENLPKKVNRNVESLVSALKKIERSISSDRSSSIADAEDESSSDDRPLASTIGVPRKNGQSPSSCEVSSTTVTTEEGEVPSSQFATKDPLSAEEQPLAPIDDFQEKLKKTILSCKEKIGGSAPFLEEPVEDEEDEDEEDEEEEEDGKEEAAAKQEVEKSGRQHGEGTSVVPTPEEGPTVPKGGTSLQMPGSPLVPKDNETGVAGATTPIPASEEKKEPVKVLSKTPGLAKMKFTSKRNELDSASSRPPSSGPATPSEGPDPERPFAALRKIEESIEQIRQECKEEMIEYHHILALTLKEMRICMDLELKKTKASLLEKHNVEMAAAIAETKRKQWCANCWKEAVFYCCWNTSYCDYPCQQAHWPKHMATCTQASNVGQHSTGVTIVNNGPALGELALSAADKTIIMPAGGGFPASTATMGGLPFDPVQ
ncbi:zinc finger MYND-type containing 8 isoform X3 [Haemaphysalis longicornis]